MVMLLAGLRKRRAAWNIELNLINQMITLNELAANRARMLRDADDECDWQCTIVLTGCGERGQK